MPKFSIDKFKLGIAVKAVARFARYDEATPGADRLKLEASDGRLSISGADMRTGASTELHATIGQEGVVAIPAELLIDAVDSVESARVELSARLVVADDRWEVSVTGGGVSVQFSFQDVGALPFTVPDVDVGSLRPVDAGFRGLLTATSYAAMAEDDAGAIDAKMGVHVKAIKRAIRAVATDGHRLATAEIQASATSRATHCFEATISTETVKLLSRTRGEITHIGLVKAGRLAFRVGYLTVVTTPLDLGPYPDVERLLEVPDTNRVLVSRAELLAHVKAARKVGLGDAVALVIANEQLRLLRRSESSSSVARFDLDVKTVAADAPQPWTTTVSSLYLYQAVKALAGDRIEIVWRSGVNSEEGHPNEPLVLRDPMRRQALIMVMAGESAVDLEKEAPAPRSAELVA